MFVLLALSLAAPVPKSAAAELYLPTKEGAKRVIELTKDGKTFEVTDTKSG